MSNQDRKKIQKQAGKQLKSGVLSIISWTAKRERYPTLKGQLLPLAKRLEKIGLLEFPKEQRQILLEKALSVLNFAEARAKTRLHWSVKDLLQNSDRIYKKVRKELGKEARQGGEGSRARSKAGGLSPDAQARC